LLAASFDFQPLVQYLRCNEKELFDHLNNLDISIEELIHYQQQDTHDIVLLCEFHSYPVIPEQLASNTFIFTFDYQLLTKPKNKIFYYCIYLFMWVNNQEDFQEISTTYLFSCANRNFNNYRPGKIYNYVKLQDKSYFNQILYTKFKLSEPFDMTVFDNNDQELMACAQKVEQEYNTWALADDLVSSLWTFDLDVYRLSLFHIVAETSVELSIVSEKTYKVFNAGQIPILCGPTGAIQHLRNLGFDVFDDIINHDYDTIDDWKTRINHMHLALDSVAAMNHEKIKLETLQRRIYNKQRLRSLDLQKLILDPIINQLKQYFPGEQHGR